MSLESNADKPVSGETSCLELVAVDSEIVILLDLSCTCSEHNLFSCLLQ